MKIRSKGPVTVGSVSSAAPTITSTRSARPARSKLSRATSACLGSYSSVTTRPCGPAPRASQMVLKPPNVPSSRMLRAPIAAASRLKNFPCWTDTAIGGNPAALLASRAALDDGSSPTTVLSKKASTSLGVGFSVMAPTLAGHDDGDTDSRGVSNRLQSFTVYPWGVYSEGAVDPHRTSHHKEKR